MKLPKTLHLILIFALVICSIVYAYGLNWDIILNRDISFMGLRRFLTSVFVLFVMVLGYFYKPKNTD